MADGSKSQDRRNWNRGSKNQSNPVRPGCFLCFRGIFMGFIISRILAAVLLILALDKHPYGYYTILRFIVCGVSGYGAYFAHEIKNKYWVWIFAIVAILFNPIRPIYLDRGTWQVIDIGVAAVLLISLVFLREVKRNNESAQPKDNGVNH